MLKLRARALAILGGVIVAALIASLFVFQDSIARFRASPRTPFQTALPPPAPDYGAKGGWAIWPDVDQSEGVADVFYVHSTTYYSGEHWNAPISDKDADAVLKETAAPNEVGPFLGVGPIYAPRYRQATLFAFFTHKFDGVAARQLAYSDVRRAFREFVRTTDPERPFIIVGYGQGGLHVQGLLQEFLQPDEDLRARLAAAYVVGQATPLSLFDTALTNIPACAAPADVRCVISYVDYEPRFDEEMARTRRRSMNWSAEGDLVATAGAPLLCVNPLKWTATDERQEPEDHVGAASATGLKFGATPPAMTHAVGARCEDGILVVDKPVQEFLRRKAWFGAKWRAQNFNLFYFDLAEDARRRAENVTIILEEEAMHLDPIEETVEVIESPINKVPNP